MRTIILFLLVACIVSCNKIENPIKRINKKLKIGRTEGLQKDLPKVYNDSSIYWRFVKRERSKYGLPSIENGSEVLQIRVWEELEWGKMVFLLKYQDNTWSSEDYIYRGLSDDHKIDSIAVTMFRPGVPKTGWNKFLNKLIDKGILDLRDESNIPGYFRDATDMAVIAVEIAAKNYYRYYQLPGLNFQPRNITDAKAMGEILDLIKNEFPEIMSQINRYSKTGTNQ